MWTDSAAGTVTFKLREPGFLKRYEGTWTITAGCGSPLAAFSTAPSPAAAAAAGAGAAASLSAAASPASSAYDLRSRTSSSGYASSSSSSCGSTPGSSPRSSWADGLSTADIFGANLSRHVSGASAASSGSSISMRTLPLATVSAGAPTAGIPQTLGQSVYSLGSNISSAVFRWLGYSSNADLAAPPPATSQQWPPLLKPSSPLARAAGSVRSFTSSSSSNAQGVAALEPPKLRPMPSSAVILASTLTSPKLTPPYPLNALLKVQSKGQVEEMLEGLVRAATAKLQAQPLLCC